MEALNKQALASTTNALALSLAFFAKYQYELYWSFINNSVTISLRLLYPLLERHLPCRAERGHFSKTRRYPMRFASHVALSLLCACALIGSATAQCTTGGGAVDLTLNGTIGIGQTIAIEMPSTLDISLIDNVAPGNAFILVAGVAG